MWWTDSVPLWKQATFLRTAVALLLGSIIGFERQWRGKTSGIRTNALVCFGAAAFVDLATTIGGADQVARVISYVVSGVGFLGAGVIIKDNLGSVRGLNTAATLWCTAAVGACAGAGQLVDALYVTVLLVAINLALRPVGRWIDEHRRRPATPAEEDID
jgi:putative Mg2+ transporter-C (MgtC) family protein